MSQPREDFNRSFGNKLVVELECHYCDTQICTRGMKAVLLADTKTELYSTDSAPLSTTAMVGEEYRTENCDCRISDIACRVW